MYPVGFDPVWMNSSNDILFYNSFKMKMAVIFGVAHMSLGIIIKGANAIHFNKKLDLFHEVVPQLMMLWALFGFMNYLIIQKW